MLSIYSNENTSSSIWYTNTFTNGSCCWPRHTVYQPNASPVHTYPGLPQVDVMLEDEIPCEEFQVEAETSCAAGSSLFCHWPLFLQVSFCCQPSDWFLCQSSFWPVRQSSFWVLCQSSFWFFCQASFWFLRQSSFWVFCQSSFWFLCQSSFWFLRQSSFWPARQSSFWFFCQSSFSFFCHWLCSFFGPSPFSFQVSFCHLDGLDWFQFLFSHFWSFQLFQLCFCPPHWGRSPPFPPPFPPFFQPAHSFAANFVANIMAGQPSHP